MSKNTRNRILSTMADQRSPAVCPPSSVANHQKRLSWDTKYMKTNFQTLIWTDEARATLDGPGGWGRVWLLKTQVLSRGTDAHKVVVEWWFELESSVMELLDLCKLLNGLKINSVTYCTFLNENFIPWLISLDDAIKDSIIFRWDNALNHKTSLHQGLAGKCGHYRRVTHELASSESRF